MELRVHRIPFSTNVERVAIAAALKGVSVTYVDHDPADRAALVALSGQELVPVAEFPDGTVVTDSPEILRRLEELVPEPPLWPADPARRAEAEIFVAWFNRVWKVAPNAIEAELRTAEPDAARVGPLAAELRATLPWFEALLTGREHLLGDALGIADVVAFPFLRYALLHDPDDEELFHRVLVDELALGDGFPLVAGWIRRLNALPRA
jgi:glutathione S-transferase